MRPLQCGMGLKKEWEAISARIATGGEWAWGASVFPLGPPSPPTRKHSQPLRKVGARREKPQSLIHAHSPLFDAPLSPLNSAGLGLCNGFGFVVNLFQQPHIVCDLFSPAVAFTKIRSANNFRRTIHKSSADQLKILINM